MSFLFRTLSLSYFTRYRVQTLLTLVGVATGVATFASIRAAQATLVGGLQATVDRVAGRAQLQITGTGGVAEAVAEQLMTVQGVMAQAPMIEQVVQVGDERPMSLLVLGVDLLGDRHMREYGFEGDDADIDDPLVFLAQPDSVALSRSFADRAGLRKGDTFEIRSGPVTQRVIARGLLTPTGFVEAFAGNVAVTDVYAAQLLFGRGRRFDRIDVRLDPGVSVEAGRRAIQRAIGPGYRVETPESRGVDMDNLLTGFVGVFDMSSVLALAMGAFLIFNVLSVAVDRRRRDIGILRTLGTTPRQIQTLFLCEACVLGVAGSVLGLVAGRTLAHWFLDIMGSTVQLTYGLENEARAALDPLVATGSLGLGMVASFAGGWMPARLAARVRPTASLAVGAFRGRSAIRSRGALALSAVLLVACGAMVLLAPVGAKTLMVFVLLTGGGSTVLLAGPVAGWLVRAITPLLARVSPVAGHLAADSLLSQPRRTATTTAIVALSLAFVLGAGGYLHSTRTVFDRWADGTLTEDLRVRAAIQVAPSSQRLPAGLETEILSHPSVLAVDGYRTDWVTFRGDAAVMLSFETGTVLDRTQQDFLEGSEEQMRHGLLEAGGCVVSANFARLHGLRLGDVVELGAPTGLVRLPIAAIVRSFVSDHGAIYVDLQLYREHWQDDRVDGFHVRLDPGADPPRVREELPARLSASAPVLVSTRQEFLEHVDGIFDGFYALTRLTISMVLVVALVGVTTSLLISVVERSREIGLMKALGASGSHVRTAFVLEAVAIAGCGLLIAVPLGALLARFLETIVSESYSVFRMPNAYPVGLLTVVTIGLPVLAAVAAWLPARQAVALMVTETLTHE